MNITMLEWRCRVKDQLLEVNDINLGKRGVTKRLQIVRPNDREFRTRVTPSVYL